MKILHPTDVSECAKRAEAAAVDLVGKLDGELVLFLALVETPLYGEGLISSQQVQTVYDASGSGQKRRSKRAPAICVRGESRRAGGCRLACRSRRSSKPPGRSART